MSYLCRYLFHVIMVLSLLLVISDAIAYEALVTDVRVGPRKKETVTRVVVELTKPLSFSVFILDKPKRVVIDLPEVGWRLPPRPLPEKIGVFAKLRYGLNKPGNSRIVLDLSKTAIIKEAFVIKPNKKYTSRLVVDLIEASISNFYHQVNSPLVSVGVDNAFSTKNSYGQRFSITSEVINNLPLHEENAGRAPKKIESKKSVYVKSLVIDKYRLAPLKPVFRHTRNKRVIILDPGHGGADPGAIGKSGIYEKSITLAMARELRKQLELSGRYIAILTRNEDKFIRLRNRVKISRESEAELFISLHADSIKDAKISGPSIYTLSERASDNEAAQLAERENKSDLIMGFDLTPYDENMKNIFIDLTRRESMNQSAKLAANLIHGLKKKVKVLRNTHRFAGFAVLKAVDVPSVLIEMGFLSNHNDERSLRSRKYRKKFAAAIRQGIDEYFLQTEEVVNY